VYYISRAGDIKKVRTNGEDECLFAEGSIDYEYAKLFFSKDEETNACDLWVVDGDHRKPGIVVEDIRNCDYGHFTQGLENFQREGNTFEPGDNTWWSFGDTEFLDESSYRVRSTFWPRGALQINDSYYAFDTPLLSCYVRNALGLRNNQLIFQTMCNNNDYIYLLDIERRELAKVAAGRGAAVICEDN